MVDAAVMAFSGCKAAGAAWVSEEAIRLDAHTEQGSACEHSVATDSRKHQLAMRLNKLQGID